MAYIPLVDAILPGYYISMTFNFTIPNYNENCSYSLTTAPELEAIIADPCPLIQPQFANFTVATEQTIVGDGVGTI